MTRMGISMSLLGAAPRPSLRAQRAHAMKNCLAIISAVLELVDKDLDDASRGRLGRARLAGERLRTLLDDDLRPPRRDLDGNTRQIDVAALLLKVVEHLHDRADARGVRLTCASAGGQLLGDFDALAEALLNLIANSIEATRVGGRVVVSSRITDEGDQEWTVEDNGEGMQPDTFRRLGQPHCTTRADGSGLGVAVARETVSRHGGLLRYTSTPAEGTTVVVWLPAGHEA